MRLSPSFDNFAVDYSPRPSIPLEPISLGNGTVKPTGIPKEVGPTEVVTRVSPTTPEIFQSLDSSAYFNHAASPKPSQPTISHPQVNIQVINHPPKPVPKVSPPVETKPIPVKPVPIQEVKKPQPVETKPAPPIHKPIIKISPPAFVAQPPKAAPLPVPPSEVDREIQEEKAAQMQNQLHRQLDDIQASISAELKEVSPPPLPVDKPLPDFSKLPSFVQAVAPQPTIKPTQVSLTTAIKTIPSPGKSIPISSATLSANHFWDYFLLRVNPKLNPYKSPGRTKAILGMKTAGLLLLALGIFILSQTFSQGFNLNVLFEAISIFTLSGILLFLAENLNLFFEPINPYKIHEVV